MSITLTGRTAAAGACAAAALLALSACGSSSYGGSGSTPTTPPAASSSAAGGAGLATGQDAKLGAIVKDAQGFTLYRFDKDRTAPPVSNCAAQCATIWPPVPVVRDSAVKGVDQNLVGTVTRADGSKQATLGGSPLYRYSGDAKAGDTNGQGVGGTWFVVAPDGTKAGGAAQSPAPSDTGSNGY
ncbi:hypothetical protein [Streptomyces sp. SPB162]|uniref:hypothetical protein n=1 Tax=Streptomyces sp. SPB162 TaxID=2940560 RepID=UPI0024074CDB|nr:hypothetical protein [Streptomyces sp. SPB162]MDF9812806.1 putative lipoprotein with Yx(FWY)xxD motif [Streptomyces sp. SPB162]